MPEGERKEALFPSTRWTLVLAAKSDPALRRDVMRELVSGRWTALYVLARKHELSPSAAEDAVQSFLLRVVEDGVEGNLVERLDPTRGSLRAYLKTAFRRHLANLRVHERADKRGGG